MPSPSAIALPVPEGLDVVALAGAVRARVRAVHPRHEDRLATVLGRLSPDQWALEWFLPAWIGDAVGLGPAVVDELVIGNLLGLVAVRTLDDVVDGEIAPADRVGAEEMAAGLLDEALRPYRRWFGPADSFWGRFQGWMAEWRGSLEADRRATTTADGVLAARGAPLKVAALAAYRLAGRGSEFPAVERCLDDGLEARVRYDHLVDWEEDLAAGRPNAFVAAATPLAQLAANRAANRTAVLRALLATGLLEEEVARIASRAERAADRAEDLGIGGLVQYERMFLARVERHAAVLRAHYAGIARRAAALLFGDDPERRVAESIAQSQGREPWTTG